MAGRNNIGLVDDSESDATADKSWNALQVRSEAVADVEATGDLGADWLLSTFHWKALRQSKVQPFDGNDGPECWTIPNLPHVEILYEGSATVLVNLRTNE